MMPGQAVLKSIQETRTVKAHTIKCSALSWCFDKMFFKSEIINTSYQIRNKFVETPRKKLNRKGI